MDTLDSDNQRTRVPRRAGRCLAAGLMVAIAACTDDDAARTTAAQPTQQSDAGHMSAHDGGTTSGVHACRDAYPQDPRDDTMTGELVRLVTGDNQTPNDPSDDPYDLLLPQEMIDWLEEQGWIQQHGDWHNVRRWDMGCMRSLPNNLPCQAAEALTARGLSRAPIQEGEPGDGYAFLVMHRHMIRGFQQAFPKHVELIRGFYRIPTTKDDPENPIPWVDIRWSEAHLETVEWMENITEHLDVFTSEDDYAKWVQFGDGFPLGGFPGAGFPPGDFPDGGLPEGGFPGGGFPTFGDGGVPPPPGTGESAVTGDGGMSNRPVGGIHGGLHSQWSVPGSSSSLTDNNKNVQNFAFWRLHVWIDDMWERYRRAQGLAENDPDYQQALIDQCDEMHELGKALPFQPSNTGAPDAGSAPVETGVFATQVAPIFNSYCGGSVCHGADSPTLGLVLAGAQPSQVRMGLVGQQASEVSMLLVSPGNPEQSWLFRKLTGNFTDIDCSTGRCTTMPPAGTKPNDQEIDRIRSWIAAGATAD